MKFFLLTILGFILLGACGCSSSNDSYMILKKKNDPSDYRYKLLSFRDTTIVVIPDWIDETHSSFLDEAKVIRLDNIKSITLVNPRNVGTRLVIGYLYSIPIGLALALFTVLVYHPKDAQGGEGYVVGVAFIAALAGLVIGETYALLEPDPAERLDPRNKDDLDYLREQAIFPKVEPEKLKSIK